MCVCDLDLFVTVQILEDTLAVPCLGKRCADHGYSYDWTSGQKPHLIENERKVHCNTEKLWRSWSQDCQPVLPVRRHVHVPHCHRRTEQWKILRLVQQPYDVEVHAIEYWETSCTTPNKLKTKMRTSIQHWETGCMICQNGRRISPKM